jgi:RsiW-degrading membrane proteinase PrsW (M82 family)
MKKSNNSKNNSLRLSEMIPFIGKNQDLRKKGFLIPGILTVLLILGLFATINRPEIFNLLIGIFLTVSSYYFIYRLAGKSKPWWLLLGAAIVTILLMCSPVWSKFEFIFRNILPGQIPTDRTQGIPLFIHMFFGAGLLEELFKVVPVFLALGIGFMLKSPWRERIGVWEPLDGILLASASAAGFTLCETLGQYVPIAINQVAQEAGDGAGALVGLQVLLPRLIAGVFGHMAYSGYFGYFIGLSVLKPRKSWLILIVGYLTAATLHTLWNASPNIWVSIFAGILAYTFLIAAILKARELSPHRPQNWATSYAPSSSPPPPPVSTVISSPFSLSIQQRVIPLHLGKQIPSRQIPGLGSQSRGVVAEVTSHPQDPHKLGLKNCSYQVWSVTFPDGRQTNIDAGKSIKLAIGMRINFGAITGEISD